MVSCGSTLDLLFHRRANHIVIEMAIAMSIININTPMTIAAMAPLLIALFSSTMEVVSSEDTFEDSVWILDKSWSVRATGDVNKFWPVYAIGDDNIVVGIVVSKFTKICFITAVNLLFT